MTLERALICMNKMRSARLDAESVTETNILWATNDDCKKSYPTSSRRCAKNQVKDLASSTGTGPQEFTDGSLHHLSDFLVRANSTLWKSAQ